MDYVFKRGEKFTCIIPVPKDLQHAIGRKQIWKALPAKSVATAKPYARRFIHFLDNIFLKVRCNMLDPDLVAAMVADYSLFQLRINDNIRRGIRSLPFDHASEINAINTYSDGAKTETRKMFAEALSNIAETYQDMLASNTPDQIDGTSETVNLWAEKHNVVIDPLSDDFKSLLHVFGNAEKVLTKIEAERITGERESYLQHSMQAKWEADLKRKPDHGVSFTVLFDWYSSEYAKRPEATETKIKKLNQRMEYTLASFTEFLEFTPGVNDITMRKAEEWRNWLSYDYSNEKGRANATVNKRAKFISTIFNLDQKRRDPSERLCKENPFKGLTILPEGEARERTRVFSDSELQSYIDYLADFHDPRFPEKTWIPVIMLLSGMRNNEVAQIHIDDIESHEGASFFMLRTNAERGQHTKSDKV